MENEEKKKESKEEVKGGPLNKGKRRRVRVGNEVIL